MSTTDRLRVRCWEGYDAPDFHAPFSARTNIGVSAQTLLSDAEAADAGLRDPNFADVLNINNAYVRQVLAPAGRVMPLDAQVEAAATRQLWPPYQRFCRWMYAADGTFIGIGQRFGSFNLVVNTRKISRAVAENEGFALAHSANARFGVLTYEDFNIFHIAIAAGINPYLSLSDAEIAAFSAKARDWFTRAQLVTDDHHRLNRALVDGDIDFYLSGGTYTVSPARRDGHTHLLAITPRTTSGPIGGHGAIAFAEITCVMSTAENSANAERFIAYLLEPEQAIRIAATPGTCNPVAQMGNPKVMQALSKSHLETIQWDGLAEDLSYCADYDIVPDHARLHEALMLSMVASRKH